MTFIQSFLNWFLSLGNQYGVNPIIFGSIYVGAIPFFTLSLGWFVKNLKEKKPIILPLFFTSLFFTSAYIYLIIVGRNVPFWVYLFISGMIGLGIYSTYTKVQARLEKK